MTLPPGYPNPKLVARSADRFIAKAVNTVEHTPIVGPWVTRLGYVKSIWSLPCAPTPEIWIYAFFQAVPIALWNAFKPSPTDYLAQRFGPNEGHGGGGATRRPGFKLETQLTEPLAKVDPGEGPGLYAMRGVQLLRTVGWYLTLADFTTDALAIWMSLAYLYEGCDVPGAITAQGHWPAGTVILFQNAWLPVGSPTWDYINGVSTGGGGVIANAHKTFAISWSLGAQEPDIAGWPATTYSFRMAGSVGGIYNADSRSTIAANRNEQISNGMILNNFPLPGSQGYAIQYLIEGSGAGIITGGHITYTETFDGLNPLVSPLPQRKHW